MKRLWFRKERLPIVFSKEYNLTNCPQYSNLIDSERGLHVVNMLKEANLIKDDIISSPMDIRDEELMEVHTLKYLDSLRISEVVARIAESPYLAFVPNVIIQDNYLRPMKFQTAGTILAAKLAIRQGWAINLGGGFHQCCSDQGGSFSPYADISLAIKYLLTHDLSIYKVMIIDLCAKQGYGHERDFYDISSVYIMDIYNRDLPQKDEIIEEGIDLKVALPSNTSDEVYLRKLRVFLVKAFKECQPDVIFYIAGTDILDGDCLGHFAISAEAIITRDEYVFSKARSLKIPILMLLGTGYFKQSSEIVGNSIINLKEKNLIPHKLWLS